MNNEDVALSVISITMLVLLLISTIIIVFFQAGKQRLKQDMDLAESKLNYEKELRKVETEVSEEMMQQFGQELHDNIGQLLTAVHIQLENIKLDHPTVKDDFKPMETYLSEATQQLRMLSRTMNNDYIGRTGLLGAMEVELNRVKSLRRFEVHWKPVTGGSHLRKEQELMIFRVFQEMIQNCLRHSLAKNIYVSVDNANEDFEITMEDDGKGFDVETMLQSDRASGLRNIIKRSEWAGIQCSIYSAPGKGCVISLKKLPPVKKG